jgi:hypothetical protein
MLDTITKVLCDLATAFRREVRVFCEQCGKELDDTARFCGACGKSTTGGAIRAVPASAGESLRGQLRVLGILWAIYSPFRILMAAWTVVFSRTLMPMFMNLAPHDADFNFAPIFRMMSGFYMVTAVFAVAAGALGIWAAWALLRHEQSGRTLALIIAFVSLISIPFGTALGVYTLVVLLPKTAGLAYKQLAAAS